MQLRPGSEWLEKYKLKFTNKYAGIIQEMKEKEISQDELSEETKVYLAEIKKWLGTK